MVRLISSVCGLNDLVDLYNRQKSKERTDCVVGKNVSAEISKPVHNIS